MHKTIRIIVCGGKQECCNTVELFQGLELFQQRNMESLHIDDREELGEQLVSWKPHLVIVQENGAAGMEYVYRAREIKPEVPVFWFSDDHEFGLQSYRLECEYFSVKPVTKEKLKRAFERCTHIGLRWA